MQPKYPRLEYYLYKERKTGMLYSRSKAGRFYAQYFINGVPTSASTRISAYCPTIPAVLRLEGGRCFVEDEKEEKSC